jgi:hypothetical protein
VHYEVLIPPTNVWLVYAGVTDVTTVTPATTAVVTEIPVTTLLVTPMPGVPAGETLKIPVALTSPAESTVYAAVAPSPNRQYPEAGSNVPSAVKVPTGVPTVHPDFPHQESTAIPFCSQITVGA